MKTELESPLQHAVESNRWDEAAGLCCSLSVSLPIANFTVSELLRLEPGMVLSASVEEGKPVAVLVNGTQIGWSKFELKGNLLAVRITEFLG